MKAMKAMKAMKVTKAMKAHSPGRVRGGFSDSWFGFLKCAAFFFAVSRIS